MTEFDSLPSNKLLTNVISSNPISKLNSVTEKNQTYNPVYNVSVTPHLKVTNQKSSGRCWLFAAMNVIRRGLITKLNLEEDFELSQNYLFFWDKLERMNYNLNCVIETREEDVNSRLVQHLLSDPSCDGGQWDMIVNLVEKYGVVPKDVYQETHHSSNSTELNDVINAKYREWAYVLRNCDSVERCNELKDEFISETYKFLCKFLGKPVYNFNWEYKTKDGGKFTKHINLTPKDFYEQFVKPEFNISDYVCVINEIGRAHV